MRVGVLVSHPIQYHSPWFRALAKQVDLHVFYAYQPTARQQGADFGREFNWDIDLLSGYEHSFLINRSRDPGTHSFFGCDTPQIAEIIKDTSFGVFIVFGWFLKSYWQAIRACRRQRIPVLVRGDSILNSPRSPTHAGVKEVAYRIGLRQFDGFLSVGKRNAEYLRHYGIPPERIFFVPHFVDNDWFTERAAEARPRRHEIRERWSADDATFVCLFVGKFIQKKRPLDFLKSIQILHEQRLPVLAVLVGTGALEGELRRFSERHQIPACFEGFQNQTELSEYYVSADALVLPSDGGETWGLVVNEAMASGLPAIVSDAVGCSPDLINEGSTGFTFPVGNEAVLAERLAAVAQMKRGGYDFAPALAAKMLAYSLEAAVRGTLNAVERLTKPDV